MLLAGTILRILNLTLIVPVRQEAMGMNVRPYKQKHG